MTDRDLSEMLSRAGEQIPMGAPPLPDLIDRAARKRRRRTLAVSTTSAAAVVAAIVGAAVLSPPAHTTDPGPAPVGSGPATPSPIAPAGTRLVGLGHAAIAVPISWATNSTECGRPTADTVIIDVGAIPACALLRAPAVDSVEITQGAPRFDFLADETIKVSDEVAQLQSTSCTRNRGRALCAGTIYFPSLGVWFRAESSTSAAVDRILTWVRIVPEVVGIPGFQHADVSAQGGAQDHYVAMLEAAGLRSEIRTQKIPAVTAGFILGVSPAPGTMVPAGTVVTLTVVAAPEGPADEVTVAMNSRDAHDEYKDLSDAEIRAGATIRLKVGDHIWAYANGKRASTLVGELDSPSLRVSGHMGDPNYPHAWVATTKGRTKVTLTITAGGRPVVLGVVTVVVT